MPACMLSCFNCVQLFWALCTINHQASLSVEFSGQEYWSGLPCPPPEDLESNTQPRYWTMSLMSPASAGGFFTTSITSEALVSLMNTYKKNP